jgi:hypothetical protein
MIKENEGNRRCNKYYRGGTFYIANVCRVDVDNRLIPSIIHTFHPHHRFQFMLSTRTSRSFQNIQEGYACTITRRCLRFFAVSQI